MVYHSGSRVATHPEAGMLGVRLRHVMPYARDQFGRYGKPTRRIFQRIASREGIGYGFKPTDGSGRYRGGVVRDAAGLS
jgi:hypothetical protein